MKQILSVVSLICLAACTGTIKNLPVSLGVDEVGADDPAYGEKVQVRYLASGGFLIRRGEHSILTAPFFSNPSLKRLMFWRIKPNPEQIDRFLAPIQESLIDVETIIIGHAHYDHLMDVSHVVKNYVHKARVYGSKTATSILAAELPADQLVSVNADAGTSAKPGRWYHSRTSRVRFMAIESEHAPHFMGFKLYKGKYDNPLDKLPTRANSWREGQTFAYLIDFMSDDGSTVKFRIHYQDATSNPPYGFPPPFTHPEEHRRIDLAIVCVAGYEQVEHYPEAIIRELNPRYVILSHWENFFGHLPDDSANLRTVPMMNAKRFLDRLKSVFPHDDRIIMPAPGAWIRFDP